MTAPIVDNKARSRFEQQIGEDVAIAEYVKRGDTITFTHTLVPPHLEGQGVASAIAKVALDQARAEGLTVVPACPFIADFVRKNPGYQDLVAKR